MRVDELPGVIKKRGRRRGQGRGSGSGHTSGRGHKGQKARGKVGVLFEGTKRKKSLVKKVPLLRGKGRMKARPKPVVVDVGRLNEFRAGGKVGVMELVEKELVGKGSGGKGVKIIGKGKVEKKLVVEVSVSRGARKAIEKAGGKVVS